MKEKTLLSLFVLSSTTLRQEDEEKEDYYINYLPREEEVSRGQR